MDEKKTPDKELFDDSFNEDFDFGEGDTQPDRHEEMNTSQDPNKKKLLGVVFVIFAVVGGIGYKYYTPASKNLLASTKPTTSATQPTVEKIPAVPEHPAHEATASIATPTTTPMHPHSTEPNFSEIAQAFSSADVAPVAPTESVPQATTAAKTIVKEGSIQDLQKELFSPEKKPAEIHNTAIATAENATPNPTQTAELNQGLNKLNQQIDYILNQIKYLDSYSREVSENLSKLNESISAMDNRLLALTNTTSTLSKDVGSVRSEVGHVKQVLQEDGLDVNSGVLSSVTGVTSKKKSDAKDGKVSIEEPEFMVHAVIPGRAWLKSAKGQIVTVAEGDLIGNYGKILVIDAANGVVLTTSGVAFR